MKKLNGKEVKYLGEGLVGVYKNGKLVERYQLEKGDNLLEGLKKLTEASKRSISSLDSQYDEEEVGNFGGGRSLVVSSEGGDKYIPEYINITITSYDKIDFGVSIPVSSMKGDFYTTYDKIINNLEKLRSMPTINELIDIAELYSSKYYTIDK